ncbi:hypothetical protein [uncultured Tateyamaria sp.]|uniref:hypothetical protein n=1 Tax=uncultured Tateyamaria sp. TaxID=455651 RepID=UPI002616DE6B|nr:hypothetical protein [uncultured Tateyamaria sp.]
MTSRILLRLCQIFVLTTMLLSAQTARSETHCDEHERYAPSGKLVEVQNRQFLLCDNYDRRFRGSEDIDFLRFPFDSSHVREVLQQFDQLTFLWGELRVKDRDFSFPSTKGFIFFDTLSGSITLSGSEYDIFTNGALSEEGMSNLQAGKFSSDLLVYKPDSTRKLPRHFLYCSGDLKGSPREEYDCFLHVDFDQDNDLVAYTRFFWIPSLSPGPPFDFDNLHILVEALVQLFENAEVP